MTQEVIARSDLDLFADAVLADPYPAYAELREAGPVVWMDRLNAYACAGYQEVRDVLNDDATFVSGRGVGFNEVLNEAFTGTIIQSDGDDHRPLRAALAEQMSVRGLAPLRERATTLADELVLGLKGKGRFDGVADFARVYPLQMVGELIGLPEEGVDQLIVWGDANFNVIGPRNARFEASLPIFGECFAYIGWLHEDPRNRLREGGLGWALYDAADRGIIRHEQCPPLMAAYLVAGIDTTVASISFMLHLFGSHPGEWDKLKANPQMVSRAYNEVLRIASPALCFKRVASRDTEIGGVPIAAGSDVVVLYAAANQDPRRYPDPARFDISRNAGDHMAFGIGRHNCAGQSLARMEANALLTAMVNHLDRIEIGDSRRHLNNTVQSLGYLETRFV